MSLPTAASAPLKLATNPIFSSFVWPSAALAMNASSIGPRSNRLNMQRPLLRSRFCTSVPEPLARQVGSLAHGLELLPHDARVDFSLVERLRGEPAVRSG